MNGESEEQTNNEKTQADGASHNSAEEAQNINEGVENVNINSAVGASQKKEQNGNGSQTGGEISNKPREWLQPGKILVVDGKPISPTEEQRQKYNNWCNENCDKPGFNYAVTADSMGLEGQDRNEYISLGMQGKLDAAKSREFAAKCSDDLPDIESLEE